MACPNHPAVTEGLNPCWRCRRTFCSNCTIELRDTILCAECKVAQVRDILAGTDLASLDFATMERRLAAWMIDGIIKVVIYMGIMICGMFIVGITSLENPKAGEPNGILLFLWFFAPVVANAYELILHAFNDGQTLGKLVTGIRVVDAFGHHITWRHALIRSTVKFILFFTTCGNLCISSPAAAMMDSIFLLGYERASLHDMIAKTRVIHER